MCKKLAHQLKLISLPQFKDALRSTISIESSRAGLLHLSKQKNYQIKGNVLYKEGVRLDDQDVLNLIASDENQLIPNNVILYSLFSYLYEKHDLRNKNTFNVGLKKFRKYLRVSTGANGYEVVAKLEEFRDVIGYIYGKGVFQVLEVIGVHKDTVTLHSPYLQQLLLAILEEVAVSDKKYWYTTLAEPNMLADKNQMAVLVAIELVILTATLKSKNPKNCKKTIKVGTIVNRIPELCEFLLDNNRQTGLKNRKLKKTFERAYDLYEEYTACFQKYEGLEITRVIPNMETMSKVIEIKCAYLVGVNDAIQSKMGRAIR